MSTDLSRRGFFGGLALAGASAALAGCSTTGGKAEACEAAAPGASGGGAAAASPADYSGLKGLTVGIVGAALDSSAVARGVQELQNVAGANEIELNIVNTSGDYQKCIDTMKAWAEQGIAGVILGATGSASVVDGITALKDKGIPVAGFFSGLEGGMDFDVTSNEWISGNYIASYTLQRLAAEAPGKGVAVFGLTPLNAVLIREVAMNTQAEFYKVPILHRHETKVPGQVPDVQTAVTDLLTKYPEGGELGAVWCGWDEIGFAAANAIESAGRSDVFVVSMDGNEENLELLRKGSVFAATVVNDMPACASVALEQVAKMVASGEPPVTNTFYVDAPFITKDNVPPSGIPSGTGLEVYYTK